MNPLYYTPSPNLSKSQQQLLSSKHQLINKHELIIDNGQYTKHPWPQIFPLIQKANFIKISFYSNNILIDLAPIIYPKYLKLKQLYLSYNKIVSIEQISQLDAPLLKDINFMDNFIVNISALRKAYFPKLQQLDLSHNPILDASPLTQLVSKKMECINIERWQNHNYIGESKRWVFKIYFNRDLKVQMNSKDRRSQTHIDEMITRFMTK